MYGVFFLNVEFEFDTAWDGGGYTELAMIQSAFWMREERAVDWEQHVRHQVALSPNIVSQAN